MKRNISLLIGLFITVMSSAVIANSMINTVMRIEGNTIVLPNEAINIQCEVFGEGVSRYAQNKITIDELEALIEINYQINGVLVTKVLKSTTDENGKVKVIVIGDSTASEYGSGDYPREGWAMEFQPFFNPDSVQVLDYALSGRSSKSFYNEAGGWAKAKSALEAGDYLFIQFGHNDSKEDEERHTDPYTTYQEYLTKYITEARALGAIPVLLTSINRNKWSGSSISLTHGDYPPAMIELAGELDVPVIDLTTATKIYFEALGQTTVTDSLFNNLPSGVYKNYPNGNSDNTHLQVRGAYEISRLVADSLKNPTSHQDILKKLTNALVETGYIHVVINPAMTGTVAGAGAVPLNDTVILKGTGYTGYKIKTWYVNGEEYGSIVNLPIVCTKEKNKVIANFFRAYEVDVEKDPRRGGTINGEGYYLAGEEVTLTVATKEGYNFLGWFDADSVKLESDTAYTFTMPAEEVVVHAYFEEATSIKSMKSDYSIRIYPVPAQETLNFVADDPIQELKIHSIDGKTLKLLQPKASSFMIDIRDLNPGTYLITGKTDKTTFSKNIIIR